MNNYPWAGQVSALLVIVAGILTCFCGYRILKVTLGILGFIAGAYAGWELGLSLAHASIGIALACAIIGGLIGMALYVWLYFLGIFLLGATAGTVVAAAFFNGTGQQAQPILLLVVSVIFGVIALVAQKFMIILSTAFIGSYLITAGVWPLIVRSENSSRVWLDPAQSTSSGTLGYAALVLWILLGVAGASCQFRAGHGKVQVADQRR